MAEHNFVLGSLNWHVGTHELRKLRDFVDATVLYNSLPTAAGKDIRILGRRYPTVTVV